MHTEPLRRLFVLPPYLPTPPDGYGGIEAVAAALLPAWHEAGADVSVCSPEGTNVKASAVYELTNPLYPIISLPFNDVTTPVSDYVAKVLDVAWSESFDVIHDFTGMPAVLTALASATRCPNFPPVIHTLHGPINQSAADFLTTIITSYPRVRLAAISYDQLSDAPGSIRRQTDIVYNGLDPADFPVGAGGGPLLCMGRICEDKGQDRLAQYCHQRDIRLDLAGTVAEMTDRRQIMTEVGLDASGSYSGNPDLRLFRSMVPYLHGSVQFHGNVGGCYKLQLLGGASALVMPNRWREPFGMVAIEAMACGTPVIGMRLGALPEIVDHCRTGFLADSFEELCEYLRPEYIGRIRRDVCRRHVERNFDIHDLAQRYLTLQDRLLARNELALA